MKETNILRADQFDRKFLSHLYEVTNKVRAMSKTTAGADCLRSLLRNKKAMLYFSQPSTRTRLSFESACQTLGMPYFEVIDTSTSSELKGETPLDSVRTFSSYADLIIMRTKDETFAEESAAHLGKTGRPVPIINAGSGTKEHPTQALLDIYTLKRSFDKVGGLEDKTIMFCGDLKRGRTVKSLLKLLTHYGGLKVVLCAPEELQLNWGREGEAAEMILPQDMDVRTSSNIEKHLPEVDAVYMTRVQDEYDGSAGETKKSYDGFKLTGENVKSMKPSSIIMHPLPRRDEIAVEIDDDPRAMYWRQVRNGMWTRAALIATVFKKDQDILSY